MWISSIFALLNTFGKDGMRALPANLKAAYLRALEGAKVPPEEWGAWGKWARFYIDFSLKYGHSPREEATVPRFLDKLGEKGQGKEAREEARRAVTALLPVMARFRKAASPERLETDSQSGDGRDRAETGMQTKGRDSEPPRIREPEAAGAGWKVSGAGGERPATGAAEGGGRERGSSWEAPYAKLRDALAVVERDMT